LRASPWNHNIHYHGVVLRSIPPNSKRALDVGCGQGLLTRRLAENCEKVIGIDIDRNTLISAEAAGNSEQRVVFIEGDVMTYPFPEGSFDLITAVATLHHLPLRPALARFQKLLKPGGMLAVIGLYRQHDIEDYLWAAIALPTSRILRCLRPHQNVTAPMQNPSETFQEIRAVCNGMLPGATMRRRLLFRYSLLWRKP
jgi:ubiquinone/menaquinone biosynthesis C-methylase UbiE